MISEEYYTSTYLVLSTDLYTDSVTGNVRIKKDAIFKTM